MKLFIGAAALMMGILAPSVAAAPPSTPAQRDLLVPISERDETTIVPRQASCNTPSNRACWSEGFDINTDYEVETPDTGVVRHVTAPPTFDCANTAIADIRQYNLTLTEVDDWLGPDGVIKKKVMLVNGMRRFNASNLSVLKTD